MRMDITNSTAVRAVIVDADNIRNTEVFEIVRPYHRFYIGPSVIVHVHLLIDAIESNNFSQDNVSAFMIPKRIAKKLKKGDVGVLILKNENWFCFYPQK